MKYNREKLPQNLSLEEQKRMAKEMAEKCGCNCSIESRDIIEDLENREDIVALITSFNEEESVGM